MRPESSGLPSWEAFSPAVNAIAAGRFFCPDQQMPNRVIRDDLLTSPRYWAITPSARDLYISILLSADDTARCAGNNFFLRTRCMAGSVNCEAIEQMLSELVQIDLVRAYLVDGNRFLFVPRFRQFVRYVRSRYPPPPSEINDMTEKKQCLSAAQEALGQRSSVQKRSEVKRSEVKRNKPVAPSDESLAAAAVNAVEFIPLVDGTEFAITREQCNEFDRLFPAVDIDQTLREIRAWNLANPKLRKTRSGILRHITQWLAKEQNGGRRGP